MRSDIWLENRLSTIWKVVMPEVEKQNIVRIRFKGDWKTKFGHIKKLKDGSTEIAINNLFRNEQVPEFIIDTTIAHELVHYMHGFHSPLPKLYRYPHQGNIVNKELNKRGFSFLLKLEKDWIKNKWWTIFPFLKQETS
tara:strand:+ start:1059 stop:1472 length:414 start_codon:yes stop_codon:yes gene_type:complete